jgi:hypothetical protein
MPEKALEYRRVCLGVPQFGTGILFYLAKLPPIIVIGKTVVMAVRPYSALWRLYFPRPPQC